MSGRRGISAGEQSRRVVQPAGRVDDNRVDVGDRLDDRECPCSAPSTNTVFDSASLVSPSGAITVTLCTACGDLPVRGSIR